MTNRTTDAASRLVERLKGRAAETVTISDGGYAVELLAIPGETKLQFDEVSGLLIQGEWTDWIIAAADLVLNGRVVEPKRGMRISRVLDSSSLVYEVQSPGTEQAWRWSDTSRRIMLRIHARRVK